jgi:hypothetical protein
MQTCWGFQWWHHEDLMWLTDGVELDCCAGLFDGNVLGSLMMMIWDNLMVT